MSYNVMLEEGQKVEINRKTGSNNFQERKDVFDYPSCTIQPKGTISEGLRPNMVLRNIAVVINKDTNITFSSRAVKQPGYLKDYVKT